MGRKRKREKREQRQRREAETSLAPLPPKEESEEEDNIDLSEDSGDEMTEEEKKAIWLEKKRLREKKKKEKEELIALEKQMLKEKKKEEAKERSLKQQSKAQAGKGGVVALPPNMLSRVLYSNPVCLLTSMEGNVKNVMTISWLTCVNNHGKFIMSMNKNRSTLPLLSRAQQFVLNVPTAGMEKGVLDIGKEHGAHTTPAFSKVDNSVFTPCQPGWLPLSSRGASAAPPPQKRQKKEDDNGKGKGKGKGKKEKKVVKGVFGLRECCAHIVCEVETIMGDWNFHPKVRDCLVNQEKEEKEEEKEEKKEDKEEKKEEDKEEKKDEDKEEKKEDISMDSLVDKNSFEADGYHCMLVCQILECHVKDSYWNGKHFIASSPSLPPHMSFLGSQKFGYVVGEHSSTPELSAPSLFQKLAMLEEE